MTTVSYEDFAKLDIRVAKIIATESIEGKSRIIKIDIIGKTQSEIFEVENDLKISVKELKIKNESIYYTVYIIEFNKAILHQLVNANNR